MYRTPLSLAIDGTSENGVGEQREERNDRIAEFNVEFNRIWSDNHSSKDWMPLGRHENGNGGGNIIWSLGAYKLDEAHAQLDMGRAWIFDADFEASVTSLEPARDAYCHILGPTHWLTIVAGFEAEMIQLVTGKV